MSFHKASKGKAVKVLVSVDKIKFDPADDATKEFNPDKIVYEIYQDSFLVQTLSPHDRPNCFVYLTPAILADPNAVIRVVAKESSMTDAQGEIAHVGCISFNVEYFRTLPVEKYGKNLQQWITLFDDAEDDEFDGELGDDDEEMPMMRVNFEVQANEDRGVASPRRSA